MPMGRYLCQLCWNIVHYGENHLCFFYKDVDEVYTVPPPNEPEEMRGRDEMLRESSPGNLNDNNGSLFAEVEKNHTQGFTETTSLPTENNKQSAVIPASRRKKSLLSLMPSTFIPGTKDGPPDSKSAPPTHSERHESKNDAKKSKKDTHFKISFAVVPQVGIHSDCETATTNSAALASVSEALPSEIQQQPHKTEKKPFECNFCGKAFNKRRHWEEHNRTHTGEKPFACSRCDQAFKNQSHLTRHFLTHTEDRPFTCEFCDKRFARNDHLERHLRIHTKEKPYKCEECGKEFADPSHYRRHLKQLHGRK